MADEEEKTEEPSSKKIEDARKDGNVPKSQDVAAVATLAAGLVVLLSMMRYGVERIEKLVHYYFSYIGHPLTPQNLADIAIVTSKEVLILSLPIALAVALAGIFGNVAQFGFIFTTKPLVPDFTKIDPVKGFMNLFSLKKLLESVKITLKVFVAMGVGGLVFWGFIKELPEVASYDFFSQLRWFEDKAIILIAVMLVILIVFAAIDLFIVRYQYFSNLKMSKQELKDEYKQMEGNPEIKGKIRRMQMEMSKKRMMSEIPTADVVITNPTHFAVALRYKPGKDRAPVIVASGVDFLALRIKEIARTHEIQIVENPPLARSLYKATKVGEEIPDTMYKAVAEVLAYVYEINKKKIKH